MKIKNAIISLLVIMILTICMFNSVAAAPVSKQTPDVHSNHAINVKGVQQTYIFAAIGGGKTVTMGVGKNVSVDSILSYGTPATSWQDTSHGIPNAIINIQNMNSDGQTWSTIDTSITQSSSSTNVGSFTVKLTPKVAGVYTFRVTYDGDSQYAPAVSDVLTLIAWNL